MGAQGSYNMAGIQVHFTKETPHNIEVFDDSWFGRSISLLLGSSAFRFMTMGYLHVFIHEMGHALVAKMQDQTPKVKVYTKTCQGITETETRQDIRGTLMTLAGPLTSVVFESIKLMSATAIATVIPGMVGMALGIGIGAGAAIWTFGELVYAFVGSSGDWNDIAQIGWLHLAASLSALLGATLLGYLGCHAIAYRSLPFPITQYNR